MTRHHPYIDEINKFIGNKIYSLRLGHGMTRKKLAESIGVTQQQLQKYEKGLNTIAMGRLSLIANTLGATIEYFAEGIAENNPEPVYTQHQRQWLELSKNFMKLKNTHHQGAVNVLVRSLLKEAA